jgi:hypothetical protein
MDLVSVVPKVVHIGGRDQGYRRANFSTLCSGVAERTFVGLLRMLKCPALLQFP